MLFFEFFVQSVITEAIKIFTVKKLQNKLSETSNAPSASLANNVIETQEVLTETTEFVDVPAPSTQKEVTPNPPVVDLVDPPQIQTEVASRPWWWPFK